MSVRFRQVIPPPFDSGAIRLELLNAAKKISRRIRRDFEATTKTWDTDVNFEATYRLAAHQLTIEVSTSSEVYRYVDEGTPKKLVFPTGEHVALRFPGTYTAKTLPGVISSGQGGYEGDPIYVKWAHIGIEARHFTDTIREAWDEEFPASLQQALDEAAFKTGYKF